MTTILREVPRASPVHHLWAGTKMLCVAALGLTLSLVTSWKAISLVAVFVVAAAALARVPPTALPRLRPWFWVLLGVAGLFSLPTGGSPEITVGTLTIGFGGVLLYLRLTALAAVLIVAALLLGATTPLGDVAPAVARLGAPLRLVRAPVDEWAVAIALCVRAFPLLAEDLRVLGAARRLRRAPGRRSLADRNIEVVDLMVVALAVAMRRAGELGEAITARGGTGTAVQVSAGTSRLRVADLLALVVTAGWCTVVFLLG